MYTVINESNIAYDVWTQLSLRHKPVAAYFSSFKAVHALFKSNAGMFSSQKQVIHSKTVSPGEEATSGVSSEFFSPLPLEHTHAAELVLFAISGINGVWMSLKEKKKRNHVASPVGAFFFPQPFSVNNSWQWTSKIKVIFYKQVTSCSLCVQEPTVLKIKETCSKSVFLKQYITTPNGVAERNVGVTQFRS